MVTPAHTRTVTGHSGSLAAAADPVLMSKITAPGLPEWAVPRPRLEKMLAQSTRGPLTMVTGPPGAGKTMAIALWAAARGSLGPCAWMTVDEYDNRPAVFWSHVAAALRKAGVAVPLLSPDVAAEVDASHSFLLRLASVLAAQDPPVVLVLDDLHLLTAPDALEGLAYLLKNAAPGLRLIAASRMDPLLPLHRYRVAGELAEIRAGDLAFSVAESSLLLAQHRIALPESAVESLTRRAEGWAAGLRLAAISLEDHPDPGQFVKEFLAEDSSITGYLMEEVLDAQPAPVRELLLRTSILSLVNADIADTLTDDGESAAALAELARTNAFVRPAGNGCYRYHALFASVLSLKLRRESPALVADLHRRAAEWYWRHGPLGEAVRHAGESGDWPLAARIVVDELAVGQLIQPRGPHPLADEFRRMPAAPPGAGPELHDRHRGDGTGRPGALPDGSALSAADAVLEQRPAGEDIPARLAAALIRIVLSRRTGQGAAAASAAALAQRLLDLLPEDQLARHPGMHGEVLASRGTAELWAGDFDQAAATLSAASARAAAGSSYERAGYLGQLALAEALRGQLTRAGALADQALGDQPGGPAASVALAWVHLDRGELRQARTQLKRAGEAQRLRPDPLARRRGPARRGA